MTTAEIDQRRKPFRYAAPKVTRAYELIRMMKSFIRSGRAEPARWWQVVFGYNSVESVYAAAGHHDCRDAIEPGIGMNAKGIGSLTIHRRDGKGQYAMIGASILKRAGLVGSALQYDATTPGRIVISKK